MTTNGTRPAPAVSLDRKAIHAYCSEDAHDAWHDTCRPLRVSVSAMLEAIAPHLADILDSCPDIVAEAGEIEYQRRRRTR